MDQRFLKRSFLTVALVSFTSNLYGGAGDPYPNITEVEKEDKTFYVAKADFPSRLEPGKTKTVTLVMERVDKRNRENWKIFGNKQKDPNLSRELLNISLAGKPLIQGEILNGATYFKEVLEQVEGNHEVWVAYATQSEDPLTGIPDMKTYQPKFPGEEGSPTPFTNDLLMAMTVVSNPQAIVTSHKGIFVTAEGTVHRPKDLSPGLQAFAAQVMLNRKLDRQFMIFTPVPAMRDIILKNLPSEAVAIGTREMLKQEKEAQNLTFKAWKENPEGAVGKIFVKPALEKIEKEAKAQLDAMKKTLEEKGEAFVQEAVNQPDSLLEWDQNNGLQLSQAKMETKEKEELQPNFEAARAIYTDGQGKSLLPLMEKYAPRLSVDGSINFKDKLEILDNSIPPKPILTINRGDTAYAWMFEEFFKAPRGSIPFVLVDLKALADSLDFQPVTQ